jgi:hypothetical protein
MFNSQYHQNKQKKPKQFSKKSTLLSDILCQQLCPDAKEVLGQVEITITSKHNEKKKKND